MSDPPDAEPRRDDEERRRLQRRIDWLEGTALPHARRQENANGFQKGWHAALARMSSGESFEVLSRLVPEPAIDAEREPVPASPTGGPLRALAVKWRAESGPTPDGKIWTDLRRCADELDAALAVASPSAPLWYDDRYILYRRVDGAPSPSAPAWQPIETAPKMRTILLFAITDIGENGEIRNWRTGTGSWHTGFEDERSKSQGYTPWTWEGHQVRTYEAAPTHWMPLPPPPASPSQETA